MSTHSIASWCSYVRVHNIIEMMLPPPPPSMSFPGGMGGGPSLFQPANNCVLQFEVAVHCSTAFVAHPPDILLQDIFNCIVTHGFG